MGVYSAMSAAGTVLGLIAGGLLVTYLSWNWVLFVNVPIGIAVMLAAPAVLPSPVRRSGGRFDLPGAITGTAGVTALVYGLTDAAPGSNGVSQWNSTPVIAALSGGVVLLAAFVIIEARSRQALLSPRLLRSRDRAGANLIMLVVGTAIFGMFVFLSLFVQDVWGYSALRTAMAFLPVTVVMLAGSFIAATLVPRFGARPLLLGGGAAIVGGLLWLSRVSEHSTYAGGLLGPGLVFGIGFGLLMVPLMMVGLTGVPEADSGAASSLLNAGRQVGGSIGLAVVGTVAWTVVAHSVRASRASAAAGPRVAVAVQRHAWAVGFDRAFLISALVSALILVLAIAMIRVRRADLTGD
jgi:MFS family permease